VLSEADVASILDRNMHECIEASRLALTSLSTGRAQVPTRIALPYLPHTAAATATDDGASSQEGPRPEDASDWTLFKPASYMDETKTHTELMGVKVVSVRSENASRGLSIVPATIMLLDATTGRVEAIVAGTELTAARTAAGSALATSHCLSQPLNHLVLFGAGQQAKWHIHALATAATATGKIPRITIVNRSRGRAEQLRTTAAENGWCDDIGKIEVVALDDKLGVTEALSTADCVVTATNTVTPLFDNASTAVKSGCHFNGVGSYTPEMQELGARTVERCRVYVDTWEAQSVGDLQCLPSGHAFHHHASLLGDALLRQQDDNVSPSLTLQDCTFYKAVGTAIQDVLTADLVVRKARELGGIGTELDMM